MSHLHPDASRGTQTTPQQPPAIGYTSSGRIADFFGMRLHEYQKALPCARLCHLASGELEQIQYFHPNSDLTRAGLGDRPFDHPELAWLIDFYGCDGLE